MSTTCAIESEQLAKTVQGLSVSVGAAEAALQVPLDPADWELWAAFYLSKFDHERLRLGNQGETFERVAALFGVKRTSFKHRRDAFDAYTGSHRKGWHQAPLAPNLQRVFSRLRHVDEPTLRAAVLQMLARVQPTNRP